MENTSKVETLNSILPYPLSLSPEGIYSFRTDKKHVYICTFKYCTPLFSPLLGIYDLKIFEFEFYLIESEDTEDLDTSQDEKVSITISFLLRGFFENELDRVIFYLCDSTDARHKERSILFRWWHRRHLQDALVRRPVDIVIETEDKESQVVHGCAMVRKDFPHMEILNDEFILKAYETIKEKYG